MTKRTLTTLLAAGLLATLSTPARAWVAAGGYHGAVAYHPPCCYSSGPSVAGAVVAGAVVGAAVASAAQPTTTTVYVAPAPAPVYYAAPVAYAPSVGTVVASLPGLCSSVTINMVSYMNCSGVYYVPYYSGGTLLYQVAIP